MKLADLDGARIGMRSALLAFVCVVATTLTACGLFLSEEEQLSRAQAAQKRGDFRTAAIDLKSLLEKHPENREARFSLGIVDLESGEVTAAIRELERARTDGVDSGRVTEPLTRAYLGNGQHKPALELVDGEIAKLKSAPGSSSRDETLVGFYRLRGDVFIARREYSAARASFESALAINASDVRSLLGLAGVIEVLEGAEKALATADRALAIAPNDATAHMARGALLFELRRYPDALQVFEKSVSLIGETQKSLLVGALAGLSQTQLALGKIDDALETTARMQKLAPNAPMTRYMRGYALAQSGKLDEAQELLERNIAQANDMRTRMLLGAVNLMQGKLGQAEMHLSSVVAAAPDNSEARQLLAQARLRQAKPGEALDILLPALDTEKSASAAMLALAGQASLAAGKTKEGVALLKRSAEENPADQSAQMNLAAGYLAAGQADQALALLGGDDAGKGKVESGKANSGKADTSAGESPEQQVRREYLSVLALLQKGDAAGAVAHATRVAQQQPQNPVLQGLAAAILMRQRQYAQARPFADAVIRLRPDDAAGYSNLARLELLQGNVDASRRNFQTALQKHPGDAAAATSLALIEMSAQRSDAALAILSDARKQNPKNVEPRVLETQILISAGKLDEAEKLARESMELAPDDVSVAAALGRVLSLKGQHSQAIETFERAVQKQPQNVPVRFQLATAHRMSGHVDEAVQALREILKIDERYIPALQLDGVLALNKGDTATATQRTDTLLKIAADQPATYELIARLRAAQQRYADSADAFRKAGELRPLPQFALGEYEARVRGKLPQPEEPLERFLAAHADEPTVRIALATAQQQRGDRAAAMRSYEQVLSNHPRDAIALNNLAWMRHEDGKPDAVDLARRAYEASPDAPAIADTYAWILVNTGKAKEALKLLDPLVGPASKGGGKTAPPDVRAHYAIALARAGRNAEAKALAKELTTANAASLSNDVRTLVVELAKS